MNYSELDILSYEMYVNRCKIDYTISNSFVGNIDKFVEWHNKDKNNMKYYYDLANIKLRKNKLGKICLNQVKK